MTAKKAVFVTVALLLGVRRCSKGTSKLDNLRASTQETEQMTASAEKDGASYESKAQAGRHRRFT